MDKNRNDHKKYINCRKKVLKDCFVGNKLFRLVQKFITLNKKYKFTFDAFFFYLTKLKFRKFCYFVENRCKFDKLKMSGFENQELDIRFFSDLILHRVDKKMKRVESIEKNLDHIGNQLLNIEQFSIRSRRLISELDVSVSRLQKMVNEKRQNVVNFLICIDLKHNKKLIS